MFTIFFVIFEPLIVTSPQTYKFVEGGTPGSWTIALNNFMSSSWLAADRTPPAFMRFSVSLLLFLTRSCSVDGVGWGGVLTSCAECVEHALA